MELEINVVDAFTDAVFGGNPAAVIITDSWLADDLMQSIAAENNLSETAFLVPGEASGYAIRWFSPITEIPFCGHATLASAFVLFNKKPEVKSLNFSAKAVGDLAVTKTGSGQIQMDFPNTKPEKVEAIPDSLLAGLSITPHEVYRNGQAYFVVYRSESDVKSVLRDNESLVQLKPHDVVVTCQSESRDYDFVSRYFWPANGGDEDPVTGSIHTGLAPFWAERLGKNELVAYQASQRGGVLYCRVNGDRVLISGTAVQYLKGQITV
ncbi:phenazine biosynthesis protein PhzF [Pseudidiomarina salinarum]|uniref:Phenazine biosynthesis protein PhzF n=1 Tax=Pseudidiomarina salinarum TaxID=435908 RepID=A0A094JEJ1_9GAMM|nr:PhzF family phenazine biosynthesis protein [Pseudidiomarina salinarum]KFZ30981.1 phenazine biosynthesis protein PhzF [Pseudidiomarina salinarum]RUO71468.1 PhzF family phenazine biosynthesis protein [Pseudidiomarina salinarum]